MQRAKELIAVHSSISRTRRASITQPPADTVPDDLLDALDAGTLTVTQVGEKLRRTHSWVRARQVRRQVSRAGLEPWPKTPEEAERRLAEGHDMHYIAARMGVFHSDVYYLARKAKKAKQ